MRRYTLDAYSESGIKQFTRLVSTLEEGLRQTVNNPFALKVSWIQYRNRKYMMSDVYRLLNNHVNKHRKKPIMAFICVLMAFLGLIVLNNVAMASPTVNMAIIAKIESSNNPKAFNRSSGAIGLCQITPIVLKDSGMRGDLWDAKFNMQVANWYMNKRIPQLLKHYKQSDTLENRLIAYNAGIRSVIKHRMPRETRDYINKYKKG